MDVNSELINYINTALEKECEFIKTIESSYYCTLELVAKLIYFHNIESNRLNELSEVDVENLIDSLSIKYPTLTEGELDFMALGLFHCYQAKVGIGPLNEQEIIAEDEAEGLALLPEIQLLYLAQKNVHFLPIV